MPDKPTGLAAALSDRPGQHRCPFGKLIDSLDAADRAVLDEAIDAVLEHRKVHGLRAANGPTAAWLGRGLAKAGHYVSVQRISQHIDERCTCR